MHIHIHILAAFALHSRLHVLYVPWKAHQYIRTIPPGTLLLSRRALSLPCSAAISIRYMLQLNLGHMPLLLAEYPTQLLWV